MDSWGAVLLEIEKMEEASQGGLPPEVMCSAVDLIELGSANYHAPTSIGLGYLQTICMSWSYETPVPIDVEIAGDHYEYYAFFNGRTEIRHFAHTPGAPVPDALAQVLKSTIGHN